MNQPIFKILKMSTAGPEYNPPADVLYASNFDSDDAPVDPVLARLNPGVQAIARRLGVPLLCYLLNADGPSALDLLDSLEAAGQVRNSILNELNVIIRNSEAETAWFSQRLLYSALGRWEAEEGTTQANKFRLRAGGEVYFESGSDPLDTLFFEMLRDGYPLLLAHSAYSGASQRSSLRGVLDDHPSRALFAERAKNAELSRICSTEEITRTVMWDTGHSVEYYASDMVDHIISGIFNYLTIWNWEVSWDSLVQVAKYVLGQAKSANNNGRCEATFVAGLGDVSFDDDDGLILNPDSVNQPFVNLCVPSTSLLLPTLEISPVEERGVRAQLFWTDDVTLEIYEDSTRPDAVSTEPVRRGQRLRQQVLDLCRLGIFAAAPPERARIAPLLTQALLVPFGSTGLTEILPEFRVSLFSEGFGRRPGSDHGDGPEVGRMTHNALIAACAPLLTAASIPSLAVSARRLVRAVDVSDAVGDRLVDLIISLEGMFGGTSPQEKDRGLSARLRGALAAVRTVDGSGDGDLVDKLVRLRGRIVHGGGRTDFKAEVELDDEISASLSAGIGLAYSALIRIATDPILRQCGSAPDRRSALLDRKTSGSGDS